VQRTDSGALVVQVASLQKELEAAHVSYQNLQNRLSQAEQESAQLKEQLRGQSDQALRRENILNEQIFNMKSKIKSLESSTSTGGDPEVVRSSITINSDHQVKLGLMTTVSPSPDPDIEAARRYKVAADRGDADAQWQLGLMYEGGRGGLAPDPVEAARLYKLSAEQGYAVAQVQLAYMYERGNVVPKNWPEAARLYRLAANQGNADGEANLADFYERGDAGLRRNACEAMRLRKLAAAQGNTYAAKALNGANATRCKP
jgi:TPR repeat protein